MKNNNIVLIGMPGVGKSTIGVILAKVLGYQFVDADLVIQKEEGKLLREIIAEVGTDGFIEVENRVNAGLMVEHSIIATGGSVVYGAEAMEHLKKIGTVIYLKLPYEELRVRLHDIKGRGVVLREGQTFLDLYKERVPLYEKYADLTVDESGCSVEQTVEKILDAAAALFAEKGYQSTTLQDIIDATGLSKGAVYHHFRSKEEIAQRVGDRWGDQMWEPLRRIREAAGLTGLQKLQAVFAASFAGDRQQRMGRTLPHLTDDPYFLVLEWQSIEERLVPECIAPLVRQGVADGSIHTGDPDALAGALFFLADLWLPPQSRPTTRTQQRARNRVFQQMTRALGLDLLTEEQALQLEELCPEK